MMKNGSEYDGYWLNNRKEGQGVFRFVNGNVFEGEWVEDKCLMGL